MEWNKCADIKGKCEKNRIQRLKLEYVMGSFHQTLVSRGEADDKPLYQNRIT